MKLNSASSYLKLQFNQMIFFLVIFLSLSSACFSCEKCDKDMSQAIAKYDQDARIAKELFLDRVIPKDYFLICDGIHTGLIIAKKIQQKYHNDYPTLTADIRPVAALLAPAPVKSVLPTK